MNEIFAARLKKLREEMGLTQEELGEAVGLSSEYISLLEAGKRTPSLIALNRISRFFQKNVAYFLETRENPFALLLADEKIDARTKEVLTEFKKICETYLELERITNRHCQLAPLYPASLSPQNMAEEERRRLGLGNEPVRDILRLGEVNGCRFVRMSLPDESRISGVFVFLEEKNAAFALINSNLSPGKQVVAAAHLYCHYLKDRPESPIVDNPDVFVDEYVTLYSPREQFAQTFASHFLVPSSKLRELVEKDLKAKRLTYADVVFLKRYFGVSAAAMLRTLRLMNYLSRSQVETYFKYDHLAEEKAIFGDVSIEEAETRQPGEKLVLSERFLLLKKEAEQAEKGQEENFQPAKTETHSQLEPEVPGEEPEES
jgi:transcriptional regulator with XRE-family HTH domain